MMAKTTWGAVTTTLLAALLGSPAGAGAAWAASPAGAGAADDESVRCTGEVCTLGACVTQRLLLDPTRWTSLRVVPNQADGKAHGFKIYGLRPGSVPAQLGLVNGDTVLSVNDRELNNPESALGAYSDLRDATQLTLALERKGQPFTRKLQLDRRPLKDGECPPLPPLPVTPSPTSAPPPTPAATPTPQATLQSLAKDISCQATRCTLRNGVVDRLSSSYALFARGGRVIPVTKDGSVIGIKLMAIRAGSLWALLGLKNGDLLHRIDAYDLTSPSEALAAYAALRTATEAHLALDRAGAPLTITYVIQR